MGWQVDTPCMPESGRWIGTVFFSLLVVVAAVGATAGVGGADTQSGNATDAVTLTVQVVDRSGNPLDGVELSATWDGGGPVNATTAGNGKAFLDVEEGADVTIRTERQFYVRNEPYVVENASGGEVTIEMALGGEATVVVRDANGRVSDAVVRLFQDGERVVNGRTGPDGTLTTPKVEQDDYRLVAFKEGYRRNATTLTVDDQVRQEMVIEQDSVLVTFRVNDDHFIPPRPVVDANVTVLGIADVTTQGNGAVTVSLPVNTVYDVDVTKPGYESVSRTINVRESRKSLNATIQRTPSINATVNTGRVVVGERVRVSVTDEYGEPVPGATVSLDGSNVGETNDDGTARVLIESDGPHTVEVSSGDLEAAVEVEGVDPAPDETPTAIPSPTPSPTPTPTATPSPAPTSGLGPGFGPVGVVVALLAAAVLLGRRRR